MVGKLQGGLRSQTVRNIKNCLSFILQYVYKPDGYLDSNPARGVLVPKPEDERVKCADPFTWQDRQTIEDCFKKHFPQYYCFVLTGFRTGLRVGELAALQWKDIDFKNRLIQVTRNVTRGKVTTPKSKSSIRSVRMTKTLVQQLKALLQNRKEEKLRLGWKETPEWVFCNSQGNLIQYSHFVNRVWNRAMQKTGLRRRTPHDMRHTYATLRLSKGDSPAEVNKEMGHASAETTYRTYYKWLSQESRPTSTSWITRNQAQPIRNQKQNKGATKLANPLTLFGGGNRIRTGV